MTAEGSANIVMGATPINLFYPVYLPSCCVYDGTDRVLWPRQENQKLAQRANGLEDDVAHMQGQLESVDDDLQTLEADVLLKLRRYMKADGVVTVSDARAKFAAILPIENVNQADQLLTKSA